MAVLYLPAVSSRFVAYLLYFCLHLRYDTERKRSQSVLLNLVMIAFSFIGQVLTFQRADRNFDVSV